MSFLMLAGMKWAGDTEGKIAKGEGAATGKDMQILPAEALGCAGDVGVEATTVVAGWVSIASILFVIVARLKRGYLGLHVSE